MSKGLVVGIFPGSDPAAIESALSSHEIDLSKVKVVRVASPGDPPNEETELEFVDVILEEQDNSFSDDMTKGTGIMSDSGGTSVPMGRNQSLNSFTSAGEALANHLGGSNIPGDEIDNFNTAIEEGRAVVLYADAGTDEPAIAAAFKAAGLRNVRAY